MSLTQDIASFYRYCKLAKVTIPAVHDKQPWCIHMLEESYFFSREVILLTLWTVNLGDQQFMELPALRVVVPSWEPIFLSYCLLFLWVISLEEESLKADI